MFYFEVGGGGNIVTRVTGYPQQGTQLQLYYMTTQVDPLDVDYNPADGLVVEWPNPAAGRYYLLLANPHPSPATYTLVATYPAR